MPIVDCVEVRWKLGWTLSCLRVVPVLTTSTDIRFNCSQVYHIYIDFVLLLGRPAPHRLVEVLQLDLPRLASFLLLTSSDIGGLNQVINFHRPLEVCC